MKDTFYFSHDYNARNDEKIIKLIQKEDWFGYGLYWALIEKLYEANGYLEEDYECIAFDLRTDCERIKKIINNYKLFIVAAKKITSKSVLHRLQLRKGKSEKARQSAITRWNKGKTNNANAMRTHSERYAIKERKGKERKGNIFKKIQTKSEYGNPLINKLINKLKKLNDITSLDGTIKENRQYAYLLVKNKIRPEFEKRNKTPTDNEIVFSLEAIFKKTDKFHLKNLTNFKYFYYNFVKIIQSSKKNKTIII